MRTIKDVAALAGVSDRTVSRVVNNEPNISIATRERVESAISQLNYIPNLAARMVRTNRSGVIGVITDVVATTPNSVEIIRGIQDRVSFANQSLLIANTSGEIEQERKIWRTFQEHRIDGVLFVTMYHREIEFEPDTSNLPTILVNCSASNRNDITSIVPNDYQGGFSATEHAIKSGHTKIGYITLNPIILAATLRGNAFNDAMAKHNLPINPDWIKPGIIGKIGSEEVCAYESALQMLSPKNKDRPTIILCGNDQLAMQTLFAANSLGLKVPQDLSVIGFDDFTMISEMVIPPLTTIALPYYEIGKTAADKLFELLGDEVKSTEKIEIDCPIIERQSV